MYIARFCDRGNLYRRNVNGKIGLPCPPGQDFFLSSDSNYPQNGAGALAANFRNALTITDPSATDRRGTGPFPDRKGRCENRASCTSPSTFPTLAVARN